MRKLLCSFAAAALLAVPGQADAQLQIGPTAAYHDDFDFGIGAMVATPTPSIGEGIGFMGDFTFFFPDLDGLDYWEINANGTWDIPVEDRPIAPFVLGGLNIARASYDVDIDVPGVDEDEADDTELGLNIGGGIRFPAGTFEPLVGVRAELGGGEGVVIFASLPFNVGG